MKLFHRDGRHSGATVTSRFVRQNERLIDMKFSFSLLAASAAVALVSSPAFAQTVTSGEVHVTGNVAGRCSVVAAGGSATSSFTGTIALGTLDEADGTLTAGLEGTSSAASGGTPVTTRVVCTSANVALSIAADTLATGTRGTVNDPNYASEINYTAEMQVALAAGDTGSVTYDTAVGAAASNSATVGRLSAAATNVTVKAYGFNTKGASTNLLVAGNYDSTITLTIQPVA